MNDHKRYTKITLLLSRFKNGKELYRKNAMFNKIINMMANGMNEFDVIEQLIIINEQSREMFKDYISRDTRPITFNQNV